MRHSHYELSSVSKQQNQISASVAIKRSESVKNNDQVFVRNEPKRRSFLCVTNSLPVSMIEDDFPNSRKSKRRFTRRSSNKPLLPEKPNEVAMEGVLLPGECVVSQVDNVTHVSPYKKMESGMRQSIRGTLFSTNFRLIFLSSEGKRPDNLQLNNENYWRNVPDFFSLPLGNIHSFSTAAKGSSEFKQLSKCVKVIKVPEEILVTCKDCKRVRFVLSGSPSTDKKVWQIKQFFQGTMHHMQPLGVTKLFAFDLGRLWKPVIQPRGEVKVPSFEDMCDWDNEIQRLKLVSWRVSAVNSKFKLTPTLPPYLVCPLMVSDNMLVQAAGFYRLGRLPTLSHSTCDGCLLMRSAYLLPDSAGQTQGHLSLLEHIYMSSCPISDLTSPLDDPERAEYQRVDVGEDLASLPQIRSSYLRMMEAVHEEERWMSSVESTRWLEIVSDCLHEAALVTERLIQQKKHVLLLEPDGRDLTALISTLVQLLCDPESRTLIGFESLIQREWVAYGHPFCSRFKHTTETTTEEEDIGFCPVFFLMLDCTWQIMRQFPTSFEFNSQYLLMLAQEACSCVSSTFLFDCIQHKQKCLGALESNNDAAFLYPFWQLRRMVYPTEQSESTLNPLFCLRQAIRSNRDMYSLIEESLGVFSSHKGTGCGLKRAVSLHSLSLMTPKRGPIVGFKSCGILNKVLISALSDNVMFQPLDDTLCPQTDLMHTHVWKDFFVSTTWDLDNSSQIYTNMVERETQKLVKRILNLYHNATELHSLMPTTPPPETPGQRMEILSQTSSEVSSARDSSLDMFNDSNSNLSSSNSCNMSEMGQPIHYIIPPTTSFIRAKTPKIVLDKDMTRSPYLSRRDSRDQSCYKIPFSQLTECEEAMYRLKQNMGMDIMCLDMRVTKEEFAEV